MKNSDKTQDSIAASQDTNASVQWIRLELIPLPDAQVAEKLLYWNPDARELIGEGVEEVLVWIQQALQKGSLSGERLSHFEVTDPLNKPSELAAILAQYYWVIPEPVESPGLVSFDASHSIQ